MARLARKRGVKNIVVDGWVSSNGDDVLWRSWLLLQNDFNGRESSIYMLESRAGTEQLTKDGEGRGQSGWLADSATNVVVPAFLSLRIRRHAFW